MPTLPKKYLDIFLQNQYNYNLIGRKYMNILKFPEDKSIESQLDERKAELDELYENLNKAFALVNKIEEKAASLEAEYNIYLRLYAHALGGIENVEVGYLEYSSGIGIDVDSGNIVFTPWSEEDETEL